MIIHNMTLSFWNERKHKPTFGQRDLAKHGFIHCSTPENFWRVTPRLDSVQEEQVILLLDETKLTSPIKYEVATGTNIYYPHIYGPINQEAIIKVIPYLKDENGKFIKNEELKHYQDK